MNAAERAEYELCEVDFQYFVAAYCKFPDSIRGLLKPSLTVVQQNVFRTYEAVERLLVVSPRQLGLTTLFCAYTLWKSIFHPNFKSLVVAPKAEMGKQWLQTVVDIATSLPEWLNTVTEINCTRLVFKNKSTILTSAESSALLLLCGMSFDNVIFEQAGFIRELTDLYYTTRTSLNKDGKVAMFGAPDDVRSDFYTHYSLSLEGKDEFCVMRYTWRDIQSRTLGWEEEYRQTLGQRIFRQEFEAKFDGEV